MLAQPFTKKTLIVVLVLAAALITLAFAVYSSPASSVKEDRSYDQIEQVHVGNSGGAPQIDSSYTLIEDMRVSKNAVGQGYDAVENLRTQRTFGSIAADHSYDVLENLRLLSDRK